MTAAVTGVHVNLEPAASAQLVPHHLCRPLITVCGCSFLSKSTSDAVPVANVTSTSSVLVPGILRISAWMALTGLGTVCACAARILSLSCVTSRVGAQTHGCCMCSV